MTITIQRVHLSVAAMFALVTICSSLQLDVFMPAVAPLTKDTYLCTQYKLDEDSPIYITEFQPHSHKEIAHHMLLYGCDVPSDNDLWNCGEMMRSRSKRSQYPGGPVCKGKQTIIYAWAMDAPKLTLPKDVAFKLGAQTNINYLVLQVHYANVDAFKEDPGHTDSSGIVLVGQNEPLQYRAGVYLLETGGYIKARTTETFEAACEMTENITIHPFAYRMHAHKLGVVNSGYVIKTDSTGNQSWTELGRRSPQLPQMFYPVTNNVTVEKGDILAGRCTMQNLKYKNVHIGPHGDDEMCNVYIMYYVDGDKLLDQDMCTSYGPPYWYFENFISSHGDRLNMSKVPADASEIPESQAVEMSDLASNQHMMHGDMANSAAKQDDMPADRDGEIEKLILDAYLRDHFANDE